MKKTLLYLLVLLASPLFAQTPLSISEAIERSLKQNFDIKIEKNTIQINQNNNNWGQAGRFPTINFSLGQNNTMQNTVNPASFLQGITLNSNIQPNVSLNWVLFSGFTATITKERLDAIQRDSEGNARIVVENTVQAVLTTYNRAALEAQRLLIIERSLKLSRDKYAYSELKKELGSAVSSEVLLEKNNYLTDSTRWVNQQLSYRNALRELNFLMAEPEINTEFELVDKLAFEPKEYDFEELKTKLLGNNATLKKQYISQEILKKEYQLRQAAQLPQISFNMGSSYNMNRQDLSQATFADGRKGPVGQAQISNFQANFQLSVPVFNGGQLRRAIQNSQILEQNGLLRIEKMKLSLTKDLAQAYDLYEVRRKLVRIVAENRLTAETNLSFAEERFKNGTINSFDYRQLQNVYLDVAFAETEALFNLIEAHNQLVRLTGGILEENQ